MELPVQLSGKKFPNFLKSHSNTGNLSKKRLIEIRELLMKSKAIHYRDVAEIPEFADDIVVFDHFKVFKNCSALNIGQANCSTMQSKS